MKKELQERLSKYTAAAVALTVGVAGANAQVVYTDVNPDYSDDDDNNNGGFSLYPLDLDNNSTPDFVLAVRDTSADFGSGSVQRLRYTLVAPLTTGGTNQIAGEAPGGYNYALALNANDMIDNTLNWIASTNTMAYNVDSSNPYNENWNGVTDKYLGLYFDIAGQMHYGWARLDVDAIGDVYTLKDYAYDATPNTGILAGTTGLTEGNMDQLVHFINQANNTVLVKVNGNITNATVQVVSAAGQVVSTGNVDNGTYTVDMNGLTSGIYMINLTSEEGSITKKMIVH